MISNNYFYRIRKSEVSRFLSPIAGMSTDDWICIAPQNEQVANKVITDNQFNDVDVFFKLAAKGNWNITERGNSSLFPNALSPLPPSSVNFGSRATDTVTYPLDSTRIYLESIEDKLSSLIRTKREAYPGLQYFIGNPPIKIRVNDDWSLSNMDGSYLWGKVNLLASTDFSSGWTFNTGISEVAGVLTAVSSGNGWSYISAALPAGTYVVCLNNTTLSGTAPYIIGGYSLASTPTTYVVAETPNLAGNIGGIAPVGRTFSKFTAASTTARIAIYMPGGTNCTIDYIHVIKVG
jgi:hypothetical protein